MVPLDRPRLRSSRFVRAFVPDNLLSALRLCWVLLIIWGEIGVFFYTLTVCRWPKVAQAGLGTRPTRILLVADAQLANPPTTRSQTFAGLFHDVYMRRAWIVTRHLHPHMVVFLGDMLRTGRYVESDTEYSAYVQHFKHSFPLGPGVEVQYVPGNVDVGLGVSNAFSRHVRHRYEHHFGRVNEHLPMANHSLILLDAPGIVDEDYIRAGHGTSFDHWVPLRDGAIEFVKGLAAEEQLGPVILFSHIPLHRAESRKCGPLRERGTIHRGVGHGWQRTLGKQTSSFLLESLRPVVIFSADDRDYCDVTHTLPGTDQEIHEITVKSFSPARHIAHPGFHLLSLYPGPTPSHAQAPCLLPRPNAAFTRLYIPFTFLTLFILIFAHKQRTRHAGRLRLATASPLPSHVDATEQLSPRPLLPPSPYSASSAYSYSYAYSNTPPSSKKGRDRTYFELPTTRRVGESKRFALGRRGGHRTSVASRPSPLPILPLRTPLSPPLGHDDDGGDDGDDGDDDDDGEDEDDEDDVRAHYLYLPPASPLPDLLARRHSSRASSPVATSGTTTTGTPGRAWSFTYTFTIRGRRRRFAVHAPAWWPRRTGGTRGKGNEVWIAVARDLGVVVAPALVTWVVLVWWYSA